jgi:hypothetical protein
MAFFVLGGMGRDFEKVRFASAKIEILFIYCLTICFVCHFFSLKIDNCDLPTETQS